MYNFEINHLKLLQLTNSSNYLTVKASDDLSQNYTLSFPRDPPAINQTLTSGQTDASKLEWLSLASTALPSSTSTIYVSKVGNDLSGNGSSNKPYATVSKAVSIANVLASSSAPVVIKIGTGTFTEDNSGNPIIISSQGISIIGDSIIGTFIVPSSLTNNLFDLTVPGIEFANLTIDAGASGSTASGIYFSSNAPGTVRIQSVTAYRFLTAVEINGGGVPIVLVEDFQARGNATSVAVSNARLLIKNSIFLGPFTGTTQANIGITVTGSSSLVTILSNSFRLMETAASNSGSADLRIIGATVEASTNGVVCSGASETQLIGVGFTINNSSSVNVSASGAGTEVVADGCLIDGHSTANESAGTGILVQNAAKVGVFGSAIKNTDVAIRCGQSSDTSTTTVIASSLSIEDSGTWDILQKGSSTVSLAIGLFLVNKISVEDSTNVSIAGFNSRILTMGNASNTSQDLIKINIGASSINPILRYEPNFYGHDSLVYSNAAAGGSNGSGFGIVNNVDNGQAGVLITNKDRNKHASLVLQSDNGMIGSESDGIRSWEISRYGSDAKLKFLFENKDTGDGKSVVTEYAPIQVDGFNNSIEFPSPIGAGTKFIWQGDTNLYRNSAHELKTDDNLSIGQNLKVASLTTESGVIKNDNLGNLSSSLITNDNIGPSAAIADTKLATISTAGKVLNSATTATSNNIANTIISRDSSGNFSAGTITGNLAGSVTGAASLNVLKSGDTMSGNLNMANNDVTNVATVSANSLAGTLTTAAQPNVTSVGTLTGLTMGGAINLATNNITNGGTIGATTFTGDLTGTASGNLALTGGTLTGDLQIPAGTTTNPSLQFTGSTTSGLATVSDTMSFITDATQRMSISSAGTVSIKDTTNGFGSAGVVHNDSSGNLSSSLIVNADVDSSAAIVDSKLATISTAGKVSNSATTATNANTASTIVARDASGNFTAGTITANLTGSVTGAASLNVLKAGDTMSGDLNMGGNNITNVGTFSAATLTGTTSVVGGNITVVTDNISSASTTLNLANSAGTGLRISTAAKILALQPLCLQTIQNVIPLSSGTTTVNSDTSVVIFDTSAGYISPHTIAMPSSPLNGQLLYMVAGPNGMSTLTFTNGTIINAPTSFSSTDSMAVQFVYNSS